MCLLAGRASKDTGLGGPAPAELGGLLPRGAQATRATVLLGCDPLAS